MQDTMNTSKKMNSLANLSPSDALIFASLLSCFKLHEKAICCRQLHKRRFTSHPLLDLGCISLLEELKLIETKMIYSNEAIDRHDHMVFISGEANSEPAIYVHEILNFIQEAIKKDRNTLLLFEEALLCLLAGECIEYAHFKAQKKGLEIDDDEAGFKQLKLLLTHCSVGQVNMLIWHAIHRTPRSIKTNAISLSCFTELAHSDYIIYSKQGIELKQYEPLKQSKQSKLSSHLIRDVLGVRGTYYTLLGAKEYLKFH